MTLPNLDALRALAPFLAGAALFGAGWYVQGLRWDADVATRDKEAAQLQERLSAEALASSSRLLAIEQLHAQEVAHAQQVETSFRAGIDAGRVGLRVRTAACPKTPDAGVGVAGTAELDPAARSDYFALRSALTDQQAQLSQCRAWVRELTAPAE